VCNSWKLIGSKIIVGFKKFGYTDHPV
jgi:hypothetical protein